MRQPEGPKSYGPKVEITLYVHPGASRERLLRNPDNSYIAYLTKRPKKGEANKALIKLLAKQFDVAKSKIRIVKGEKSKHKIIELNKE